MEYQPDWKSKIIVTLLGKHATTTLLDTAELMFKEDFKHTPSYTPISNTILITATTVNLAVITISLILNRTLFRSYKALSPTKLICDGLLVGAGYYCGALYLSDAVRDKVNKQKGEYLKKYDDDFMFHFNILSAKYDIEEEIQVQGVFNHQQYAVWINNYYQRQIAKTKA